MHVQGPELLECIPSRTTIGLVLCTSWERLLPFSVRCAPEKRYNVVVLNARM